MVSMKCSLCGWESNQKRFKYKDINKHFENAIQIRCPRNYCKEQYDHSVPKDCICNTWYDYGGWETIEKRSNVISIEDYKAIKRAKEILNIGLQIISERGNYK